MESSTSNGGEELHPSIIGGQEDLTSDESEIEVPTSYEYENKVLYCMYCQMRPCICPNTVGRCSCALRRCVFYSPRIVSLLKGQRTEFETARDHWTAEDAESAAELERIAEDNRKYYDEVLVKHPKWGAFFGRFADLEVGAKIGEGGQAEIFAATSRSSKHSLRGYGGVPLVAKVWKEGVSLRDLELQWPPQMLLKVAQGEEEWPFVNIYGGAFIRDGELRNRFAFVMRRQWADLRTLIDERMQDVLRYGRHGPPFNNIKHVVSLMWEISEDLLKMHEAGVLHRDIKASNVLLGSLYSQGPIVIDYECSVGLIGTGFWRAPEILEQLQKKTPGHKVMFTKKADIYSFGMLCYEVITGLVPFEGHPQHDYNRVLRGGRPKLPPDLDPRLKSIVLECWQHEPQLRPTLSEIHFRLGILLQDLDMSISSNLGLFR